LPELLFESCRFELTASEPIESSILRPAEINSGYQNQKDDENNKNVTI